MHQVHLSHVGNAPKIEKKKIYFLCDLGLVQHKRKVQFLKIEMTFLDKWNFKNVIHSISNIIIIYYFKFLLKNPVLLGVVKKPGECFKKRIHIFIFFNFSEMSSDINERPLAISKSINAEINT